MIYDAVLDQQNGSITVNRANELAVFPDITQEYTEEYLLITDHTDTPAEIYKEVIDNPDKMYGSGSKQIKIPTYNSKCGDTEIEVTNIAIDRWDKSNMKSLPSFALNEKSSGSYASWRYTVTYANNTDSNGSLDTEKAPWKEDIAFNCTLTPKEYTENTARAYASPTNSKRTIVRNAAGDLVYRNVHLRNYMLSFDYAVKKFDASYIIKGNNTSNKTDVVVAGIPIPAGCGLISNMTISVQKWKKQKYYQIHVDLEIAVEKPVVYTKLLGSGYNALLSAGDKDSKPIHKYTGSPGSTAYAKITDNKRWMDKDRGYGSFAGLGIEGLYEAVGDKMILNKDGTLFKDFEKGQDLDIEKYKDKLDIIKVCDHLVKEWKYLDFPKKGLMWEDDSSDGYEDDVKKFLYGGLASRLSSSK